MKEFERPIPGMSLTDTPKDAPWERPSDMVEVADVVDFYLGKIANDEAMDDLAAIFESGGNIDTVVNTMIKMGTMRGVHPHQSGMLAAPAIAAFIKSSMSIYGIDAKETLVDPKEAARKKIDQRTRSVIKSRISEIFDGEPVEDMSAEDDMMPMEEPAEMMEDEMVEPEVIVDDAPVGLMAKE